MKSFNAVPARAAACVPSLNAVSVRILKALNLLLLSEGGTIDETESLLLREESDVSDFLEGSPASSGAVVSPLDSLLIAVRT